MSNPVAVLRTLTYEDSWVYRTVWLYCPACVDLHPIRVEVNEQAPTYAQHKRVPVWDWNGDLEKPTFDPSLKVVRGKYTKQCHSFIRDGFWEYLSDSDHSWRGRHPLVPLPDWFFEGDDEDEED